MGAICCKDSSESVLISKSVLFEDKDSQKVIGTKGILIGDLLTSGNSEGLKFTEAEREFVNIWKTDDGTKRESPAVENGECSVCFEPLSENQPTVMQNANGSRSCRHFICFECAEDLLETSKTCPLCRKLFEEIKEVPELLKNPQEFFEILGDENNHLSREDVKLALNAILPISSGRITMDVKLEWNKWDPDGNGYLTVEQAKDSVCHYVARKIHLPRFQKGVIPDISKPENSGLWFDYWDWDNRGRLAKHEIARAMLKTFSQLLKGQRGQTKIKQMCEMLLIDIWPVLELKDSQYIELDEFIREDGLAMVLMQLLWQTKNEAPSPDELLEMGFDGREFDINAGASRKIKSKPKPKPVKFSPHPKDNLKPDPGQSSSGEENNKESKEPESLERKEGQLENGLHTQHELDGEVKEVISESTVRKLQQVQQPIEAFVNEDKPNKHEKPHQRITTADIASQVDAMFQQEVFLENNVDESKHSSSETADAVIPSREYCKPLSPAGIKSEVSEQEAHEDHGKFGKVLPSEDELQKLSMYLHADGLPFWWIRRETNDGKIFYQNNMEKNTSWEIPSDEQIRKEYDNGAAAWYRSRQQSYERAKLKHAAGSETPRGEYSLAKNEAFREDDNQIDIRGK